MIILPFQPLICHCDQNNWYQEMLRLQVNEMHVLFKLLGAWSAPKAPA